MPKVTTFLNENTIQDLKDLCKSSGRSLSKVISELVELGYEVKQHRYTQESEKNNLVEKHTEYLLRIMAIVADSYRCIRNERSKYDEDDVNDVLATITTNALNYIDEKLGKS